MITYPILIGGAPCSGKSTIAKQLSKKFEIPWIPTDWLRYLMAGLVHKEEYPSLFNMDNIDPVEYLSSNTPTQIIRDENERSKEVYKIIKLVLERKYDWNSYIIEGVSITPELIVQVLPDFPTLKYIFLIENNVDRIKEVIYTRGLWDDADQYPDSVKGHEVEWVIEYNKWLKEECIEKRLNYLEIINREDTLERVLEKL